MIFFSFFFLQPARRPWKLGLKSLTSKETIIRVFCSVIVLGQKLGKITMGISLAFVWLSTNSAADASFSVAQYLFKIKATETKGK